MRAQATEPARRIATAPRTPLSDPAAAAWLCVLPCAAVTLAAIVALGPPLGRLGTGAPVRLLPAIEAIGVHPEPAERGRYVASLIGPVLLAVATYAVARWQPALPRAAAARTARLAQVVLVAFVGLCMAMQYRIVYGADYGALFAGAPGHMRYFTPATLVAGFAFATAATVVLGSARARAQVAGLLQETRTRRILAIAVAVTAAAVWLLPAVNSDASIATALQIDDNAVQADETFAVVNGLTPLVDFTAQYANLWPYVGAIPLMLVGTTLLVWTTTMAALTLGALLAAFGVLRRVTRSSTAALALFLPFLATSLFAYAGDSVHRVTPATYFATFPLRYTGPYVLAWLTARRIATGRPAPLWPVFLIAGLVAINNLDFGVPALGATITALVWSSPRVDRRFAARLAAHVAGGLLAAGALLCALTLVRAGALPQLHRLTFFGRIFTLSGYAGVPMPALGLHLIIYTSYAAAIALATVRALAREPNRVLTGMLAWIGVFGLGSGAYFVPHSHPHWLVATFSAWSMALSLLAVAIATSPRRERKRPGLAAFAVLVGVGVTVCSLAQVPAPWSQVARIAADAPQHLFEPPMQMRDFVASTADGPSRFVYRRDMPIALLLANGHRVADAYGVRDVMPYNDGGTIVTAEQVDDTIQRLREAGGNTVVLSTNGNMDPAIGGILARRGFAIATLRGLVRADPGSFPLLPTGEDFTTQGAIVAPWTPYLGQPNQLVRWVDTRHLHPRALRSG